MGRWVFQANCSPTEKAETRALREIEATWPPPSFLGPASRAMASLANHARETSIHVARPRPQLHATATVQAAHHHVVVAALDLVDRGVRRFDRSAAAELQQKQGHQG